MSIQHYIKKLKQIIEREKYYGVRYIFDYIFVLLGLRKNMESVIKKEESYYGLSGESYINELARWYKASTGDIIDFKHPTTFNQKLQWCKVYDTNPLKTLLADKYLVRDWVAEKIGEKYLIPIIGVWNNFDEINFTNFPNEFVLKCNHGSGYNIIVDDIKTFDREETKEKIDKWMSENFAYKAGFELHYKNIVPKIIAEEYMENGDGELYDYKFYCFDGKVNFIQFLSDRRKGLRMAYYNTKWEKQNFVHNHPMIIENIPKPDNLDEMIKLAEVLSQGFPYVRVDFYRLNDGTIKFGEMTFTPASGTQDWNPPEANRMLGELLHIPALEEENK